MPGLVPGIHGTPTERQPLPNSRVFPQPANGSYTSQEFSAVAGHPRSERVRRCRNRRECPPWVDGGLSRIVRKIAGRGGEADIPPMVPAENPLALDGNLSMSGREGFFDATPSREEAAICWIKRKDIPTPTTFLVLRPADWNRH
jgi:hypothetical protein